MHSASSWKKPARKARMGSDFMDCKEFLKPTKAKLLLAAALFMLFVPFMAYDNGTRCIRAPCHSSDTGSMAAWLLHSQLIFPPYIHSLNLPLSLLGILICYPIGCALAPYLEKKLAKAKKKGK